MSDIGKSERATQNRVIALFRDELDYTYLGDWSDRDGNSNIEEGLLTDYLKRSGYSKEQIAVALYKLRTEADNHSRSLYGNNKAVYSLLRYGVPVKIEAGKVTETVSLINWGEPAKNDFAIAEEVTLKGNYERRPDLVLYINGIAIGVLELKNSRISIGDGIRQNLSNQQPEFNQWFSSSRSVDRKVSSRKQCRRSEHGLCTRGPYSAARLHRSCHANARDERAHQSGLPEAKRLRSSREEENDYGSGALDDSTEGLTVRQILLLAVFVQIPYFTVQAQTVNQYKTVYSSGGYMYETDTLDASMDVSCGVAQHTITPAFSLKKPDGTSTPFSATQHGDACQYFDPSADGSIPLAEIGTYIAQQDDEGVCTIAGVFLSDDVYADYIPPPELDAVQNWGPMTNTFSVDSSGTMVLYGYSLLCEDTCSEDEISFTFSPSDSNIQTSVSSPGDEQFNLNYTISPGAIAGTHTICITTPYPPDACSTFMVGDGTPVITSVSPSTWTAGTSVPFTITGSNFGTAVPGNANTALPISPSSVATFTVQSWKESVIQATAAVSPSASGSASLTVTSTGFGSGFQSGGSSQSQTGSPAVISVVQPAAVITSILPALGMAGYAQPVTFAGNNFGTSPPKITAGGGITVSNVSNLTGSNGTGVTAILTIPASGSGGNASVTLTPVTGNTSPASTTFFVQIPKTLIRASYPGNLIPGGYGPLMTPVNQPVVNAADQVLASNTCGVYRNLGYSVMDQETPAKVIQGPSDVTITETFSNFTGADSIPPTKALMIDLINSPYADMLDNIALFHTWPTCLSSTENQSFTQAFSLTYSGNVFSLSLTNSISRGNFSGTLKDDVTISHN